MDSGATTGCKPDDEDIINLHKLEDEAVTCNYMTLCIIGEGKQQYTMDTPLVPGVKISLDIEREIMSVFQTCKAWGCTISFNKDGFIAFTGPLKVKPSRILATGEQCNRQYYLNPVVDRTISTDLINPKGIPHSMMNFETLRKNTSLWEYISLRTAQA